MKYCNQCGAQLDDDMMFCGTCGAKQEAPATPASPAEIPAEAAASVAAAEAAVTGTAQAAEAAVTETAEAAETAVTETAAAAEAAVTETAQAAETAVTQTAQAVETAAPEPLMFFPSQNPASDGTAAGTTEPANPPKKSKKGLIIGIIAAVAVVAAVVIGLLVMNALKKETIDASKLVKVTGYGPNGFGKGAVMVASEKKMHDVFWPEGEDEEAFPGLWDFMYERTKDEETYPEGVLSWIEQNRSDYFRGTKGFKTLKNEDKIDEAKEALAKIKVSIEDDGKNGSYSVGDTIKIIVKADEDDLKKAHVKLTNTTFEYTFTDEDFAPCKKIDPFAGFTCTFEGYEGNPDIKYSFDNLDPDVKKIMYHSVNYDELYAAKNNGDKITFTASLYGDLSKGYLVWDGSYYTCSEAELTKVVTVSGLKELTDLDLFEGIRFDFEGCVPSLGLSVNTSGMPQIIQDNSDYIDYRLSQSSRLDIGDVVTVTARVSYSGQKALAEAGYKYDESKMTMEYTIPANAPHILDGNQSGFAYDPASLFGIKEMMEACIGQPYLPGNVPINGTINVVGDIRYSARKLLINQTSSGKVTNALWQLCEIDYTVITDGVERATQVYLICKADDAYVDENNKVEISASFNGIYCETMEAVYEEFQNGESKAGSVIDF